MISYTTHALGDNALLLQFKHADESELLPYIHSLTEKLLKLRLNGIRDIVPAFTSLAIYYDPILVLYDELLFELEPYIQEPFKKIKQETKLLSIPVCYDETYGLDILEIAHSHNLSVADLIQKHTEITYTVAIMGFLPGFPYLVGLDEKLWTPRKSTPRTHVPKGAVAIGGSYTGIYPIPSPGGWNIIGQTPISLFNSQEDDPFLLIPGNQIQFYAISKEEFIAWR